MLSQQICRLAVILAVLTGLGACPSQPTPQHAAVVSIPSSGKLLLDGVTIVDTRTGRLSPNMSLLAEAGKISAIGPTGTLQVQGPVQIVDAKGKFVVPGYLDMHVHVLGHGDDPASNLALMLANGITGFRQMAASKEVLTQRRAGTLPLTIDAPALLQTPGEILTPLNAATPEDAVRSVDEQKAEGADFIKCCIGNAPVFMAAVDEGRRIGIPVLGHVPADVSVVTASRMGYRSIEHMGPSPGIAVACSSVEDALMKNSAEVPAAIRVIRYVPFADALLEHVLKKLLVNTALSASDASLARLRTAISTFDAKKCKEVAGEFIKNGTWVVPTLVRIRSSRFADDPAYAHNPNLRYLTRDTVERWQDVTASFEKKMSPADRALLRDAYAADLRMVKFLDESGVKMLAGTDVTGAGWLIPGFALHQEFDELGKAGLAPLRVLQMTTLYAAEYLGRTGTMGTVEPGKEADLVVLNANPIESIQNLHAIDAVVRAGFYRSQTDLVALKKRVEAAPAED